MQKPHSELGKDKSLFISIDFLILNQLYLSQTQIVAAPAMIAQPY